MACRHRHTTYGRDYYPGSYDHQHRAAQGGVSYDETCTRCGATRRIDYNGRHVERGPWRDGLVSARDW